MNSTITDWTTCTISVGVPVSACIRTAPARSVIGCASVGSLNISLLL